MHIYRWNNPQLLVSMDFRVPRNPRLRITARHIWALRGTFSFHVLKETAAIYQVALHLNICGGFFLNPFDLGGYESFFTKHSD